jgi:hypothetical protein
MWSKARTPLLAPFFGDVQAKANRTKQSWYFVIFVDEKPEWGDIAQIDST